MKWHFVLKDPEAGDVLKQMKWFEVKLRLDEESRNEAIKIIESYLRQYKKCYWTRLIRAINAAIREELLKSRNVIDVKMIQEVVEFLSGRVVEGQQVSKKNDKGSNDDSGSDDRVVQDADSEDPSDEWDYEEDRYQGSESESEEDLGFEDVDDDENNLSLIRVTVKNALDNVETVKNAFESRFCVGDDDWMIISREEEEEEDRADAKNQVHHSLEKNMVPTEEEIAATMNQIHQEERREYGDKMEIEEQEILIRSNQREQEKESTGNAYSCIRESLKKGGTNKRKFAEV